MKSRREFIEFMGRVSLTTGVLGSGLPFLTSCASPSKQSPKALPFKPLSPSFDDDLKLAQGFEYQILIKEGDALNQQQFGSCNDFLAFIPLDKDQEGLLWVNHEYFIPLFTSGYSKKANHRKTAKQIELEKKTVGGSILHIKKQNHQWTLVQNSRYNRRLDATTPIPFSGDTKIQGSSIAVGTLANCAGGVTPWNTILSCEENYHQFYGEVSFKNKKRVFSPSRHSLSWTDIDSPPPEHYGWVVEIDPKTGQAQKHTALGRFAHEGATCVQAKDGRTVVYMGDDKENECFYKFVSKKPNDLSEGILYVANLEKKKWIALDLKNPLLKDKFETELDLKIRTREAAALVGGTKLDRPEDCEIDPHNRAIYLCCTNNDPQGRHHGVILKFVENDNDFTSEDFTVSEFFTGGTSFSCPDNLAFDSRGNMWMTSDMAGKKIGTPPYEKFGNNALYYIPLEGEHAGQAFQVASAPKDAEFTGPCFSPDGKTLFLSVQHPGERTQDLRHPESRWPLHGSHLPLSSVVQISGPALEALTNS